MDSRSSPVSLNNRNNVRNGPPPDEVSAPKPPLGNMNGVRVESSGSPSTITRVGSDEELPQAREIPTAIGVRLHDTDAFAAYDIAAASGTLEAEVIGVIPNQQPASSSSGGVLSEVAQFLGVGGVVAGGFGVAYELGAFPATAAGGSAAASISKPLATSHEAAPIIAGLKHLFFGKAAATAAASVLTPPIGLLIGAALTVGYIAGNSADKMSTEEKKKLQIDTGKKFEMSGKISTAQDRIKNELDQISGHDESVGAIKKGISKIQNSLTRLMLRTKPADDFDQEQIKREITAAAEAINNPTLTASLNHLLSLHAEAEETFRSVVS